MSGLTTGDVVRVDGKRGRFRIVSPIEGNGKLAGWRVVGIDHLAHLHKHYAVKGDQVRREGKG